MSAFVKKYLQDLDPEKEFCEARAAEILGVSAVSLFKRRQRGTAMPHRVEARGESCRVWYTASAILEELEQYGQGGRR